jgi:hypothetical protein
MSPVTKLGHVGGAVKTDCVPANPHPWLPRVSGALFCALALGACIDDRQLEPAPPAFEGVAGDGGDPSDGPASGGQPSTPPDTNDDLVGGCADLDTDGVADCDATLVDNPSFSTDVTGWSTSGTSKLSWSSKNALDDADSGSAKLTDDSPAASAPRASAYQCVKLEGNTLVVAWANAFVEAGDAGDEPPRAELEVTFIDGDDCTGTTGGYFETPPTSVTGGWTVVQAGARAPASTHSVAVALVAIKSADSADLSVYFDNIMLKAVPLD